MKKDAELIKQVRDTGHRRREAIPPSVEKSAPAEKAIHIPLPFDAVMSAVVKIKPEPKKPSEPTNKKRR
jgi:hypothetical protein